MLRIRTLSAALLAVAVTTSLVFSLAIAGGSQFKPVKSVAELDKAVADAKKAGKRVMIDFTADWCAPCKKMEKETFPAPAVQAALKDYVFLQVDVTQNSADDQALLKRFESKGPPVIAFFDTRGNELKKCQVNGFQKPDKFSAHIVSCTKA